ncbi:helix-turn-helix domain-containing protein [Candidatus Dojkabacteria bacterium]|uniref:Helix-turn-helix domain-containing protein n=1 Tax=Candidatus Dojkabacteria bacterium TaxID=2099670 RepID=A0A955L5Z1_9BACT|nr:helix-turn-helix domain-containing protein [Candidatus Dojkabacteria bacterium]
MDYEAQIPKSEINKLARLILSPLQYNASLYAIWPLGSGMRIFVNKIFNNFQLVSQELNISQDKLIVLRIECDLLFGGDPLTSVFIQLYKGLVEGNNNKALQGGIDYYFQIRKIIEGILDAEKKVLIVINGIDKMHSKDQEILLSAFSSILYLDITKIHAIFNVSNHDVILGFNDVESFGLFRNIVYIPNPTREEFDNYVADLKRRWGVSLDPEQHKLIELCFPNKMLANATLKCIKEEGVKEVDGLLKSKSMRYRVSAYYHMLGKLEREFLEHLVFNSNYYSPYKEQIEDYFIEIGVVKKIRANKYALKPKMLNYIVRLQNTATLIKNKVGEITYGKIILSDNLSIHEYEVFELLYKKKGSIVNRDEIANAIWGEGVGQKYSDWAIDKLMSRLRKKLFDLAIHKIKIDTHKKQGFKLIVDE